MKFGDISKPSKDLLNEDYTSAITLKCKGKAGPFDVTVETLRSPAGALSSKVGGKFAYAGLNFDKVQATADGSHVLETSLIPCTGCKLTFKANKGADQRVDVAGGGRGRCDGTSATEASRRRARVRSLTNAPAHEKVVASLSEGGGGVPRTAGGNGSAVTAFATHR